MGISADDWNELASIPGTIPKPPNREKKQKGLKPGEGPERKTPVKKVNKERAKSARARDFDVQAEACYHQPCYACGRERASMPHHEPPRKRGGTDKDCVPLCDILVLGVDGCHQDRHRVGEKTFWNELGRTPQEAKEHVRLQAGITIYD